jgi:dTDP-glucose 4,6-dehydratase
VRQLIAAQAERVVNLDKLTYAGNLASLAAVAKDRRHVFVQGDIADAGLVADMLTQYCPAAVVNLAAETHVDRSIDGPSAFVQANVVGAFTLLEAVRQYWSRLSLPDRQQFRFLHVSTDEVYGSLGSQGKFTEATAYAPTSPYSASKASADHFVRAYRHTYGLPTLVTNCSNNYGPYQFPEKLIPLTILNAIESKPLPIYGDGQNIRDWLHVDDHCQALRCVLERGIPGETYHIGGDCERTNLQVVENICGIVDRLCPPSPGGPRSQLMTFVRDRPGHDRRYAMDAAKIRRELGWKPRQSFDSGLEETVKWYLDHLDWAQRVTSGIYQRERLGAAGLEVGA